MKNITILLIVIFVISTSWIASTAEPELESVPEITYGDGWIKNCIDIKCNTTYGITTYKVYNGSYTTEPVQSIAPVVNNYSIIYNGGEIRTIWDGVLRYDMILDPDTGAIISPWSMWKVESFRTTGKGEWQEEIPLSSTFTKVNSNTLINEMILASGGKFNITYRNLGTKIKFDLDLTAGYNRNYRLTYRIDAAAGQDLDPSSKKYTPGFFGGFTVYDWTDVPPYTVDENGAYLGGYNTSEWLDQTGRKFYQTIVIPKKLNVSERVIIDPSWSVGSGGSAWSGNSSFDNVTLSDNGNVEIINGSNPALDMNLGPGVYHITPSLDNEANKVATRFTAQETKNVSKVMLYRDSGAGTSPYYNFSIQEDDGNGNPSDVYLGYNTSQMTSNGWHSLKLNESVQLIKGSVYHIVVKYNSGTINSSNYIRLRSIRANSVVECNKIPLNIFGDKNKAFCDINLINLRNIGAGWVGVLDYSYIPVFLLEYDDGSQWGQPYDNSVIIAMTSSTTLYSQSVYIKHTNKTINKLEVRIQGKIGTPDSDLYIELRDSDNNVLVNETLIAQNASVSTHTWYSVSVEPIMLAKDTRYYVILKCPGCAGSNYYRYYVLSTAQDSELTYDGTTSYYATSANNGSSWTTSTDKDIPIRLSHVTVLEGSITLSHNAGSGNKTYQIDVNATTPDNTNYTVWYRQNGTGSYSQLGGTLTGNNSLAITTKYQDTEVQVRLAGNETVTPEIMSVTFYTQSSEAPDTSFSVSLPEGYTYIMFNASNSTVQNLYPDGQTLSISFFNFTNGGNVAQSFRFYLNSTITGITTYGDLDSDHSSGKIEINTSTTTVVVSSLSIGSSQNVWMLIDTDRPVPQDTNITLTINSS